MQAATLQKPLKLDWRLLLASCALILVWNVLSWHFPFFWDAVLYSKMASWYLETDFQQLILPRVWDPGHPPFFGIYIALTWKIFGRSLLVAHLAMVPMLLTIVVQFQRLASRWLSDKGCYWAMLLLFCEPTFLAQMGMLSPDIAILAFYLLAINALMDGRRWLAAIAMVLLGSVSVRGITMVPTLIISELLWARYQGVRKLNWRQIWAYVPFMVLTAIWMLYHHSKVGSWLSPPHDSYSEQRQLLDWKGMLRNVVVIVWRWLDYGRIFLWLFVGAACAALGFKQIRERQPLRNALLSTAIFLAFLAGIMIPFVNPPGHRYFLTGYLFLILAAVAVAELGQWRRWFKIGLVGVMLGLVSGHFWLYPNGIAQGWDSSLAHLPVFSLQQQTNAYFVEHGIAPKDVCADFPFLHSPYDTYVIPDKGDGWYRNYLETTGCDWVINSNLINGYSDAQIDELQDTIRWEMKADYKARGMFVQIFHRR